jgi:hypothetical protein
MLVIAPARACACVRGNEGPIPAAPECGEKFDDSEDE